jgi:SAM-dependent methyltransferase
MVETGGLPGCWSGATVEIPKTTIDFLIPVRDRVLRNAALTGDDTLLDVGAGDGRIAFGALELVGEGGHVIFSDVSQDLLDHSRSPFRWVCSIGASSCAHRPTTSPHWRTLRWTR